MEMFLPFPAASQLISLLLLSLIYSDTQSYGVPSKYHSRGIH